MTTELLVRDVATATTSGPGESSTVSNAAPPLAPFVVPGSQLYYWTHVWQAGEAESRDELARGDAEVFDDGRSAIRWLFSADA